MPPIDHVHMPMSVIGALIQPTQIDALLARWLPDPEARAFIARCILEAGPIHHRGANYVLLLLLAQALDRLAAHAQPLAEAATVAIPMRLPGSHAFGHDGRVYPLRMNTAPLRQLAQGDDRQVAAMIDCLVDGPPQHALANALMVNALGLLITQLEQLDGGRR